jgi:DMSO/TMAO reductase YedYZ molybdopterin-dependent catalytic subunit
MSPSLRLPDTPPPGPFRPAFWRSPLRGPWLTAALGSALLVLVSVVAVTGFLSHVAYQPDLAGNAIVDRGRDLPWLSFDWPAGPTFLYAVTQGLHVNVGLVAIPFLLAKLWSVIPRLFAWPPVATPAQAVERLSIALLVSSAVFQFVTGVMNIQYWYAFGFNFVVAHYYGAIVFVASLALHVAIKMPVIVRAYRERGVLKPLRDDLARTRPEPGDEHGGLVAVAPAAPTISRRGLFAMVGAGSLALLLGNVGETIGGPLRRLSLFAPRRQVIGSGPNDFQVNKSAVAAGITEEMTGREYRLVLSAGGREVQLSRDELLALPQHTARLPIACVEGWTTTQEWTGVRLAELARLAGATGRAGTVSAFVRSLQPRGVLNKASLNARQLAAGDALLALKVNGADLSPDHGFPARVIVPALPGVHNTKWVASIEFRTA